MRHTVLALLLIYFFAQACAAGDETFHGFVVGVTSPTKFTIEDYSSTRDGQLSLEFGEIAANTPDAFKPGEIQVGDEIEITGVYNPAAHQLTVKSAKVLPKEVRKISSTAFPDKPPELQKTPAGWSGYIFVDGMRIRITDATSVTLRRNKSELEQSDSQGNSPKARRSAPLASLEDIDLDTMEHYEGVSRSDGSVLASKVEFEHFELKPSEIKSLQKLAPTIKKGNSLISQPDELHIGRSKFKLVPAQDAQDYLQRLGESLVSIRQRDLPADSALKIQYRYYLTEDKDFGVVFFPNGVIVVNSGLIDGLENEAQLAYYLSRAMALVEEQALWRVLRHYGDTGRKVATIVAVAAVDYFSPVPLGSLVAVAINRDGYVGPLVDQADRLALEWMLAAGYDIREVPRAYKAYVLKHPDHTPLYPNGDANQTEKNGACAARRSFLMSELRNNYAQTNYSSLKKDSEQFHAVARQAHDAEGKKITVGRTGDKR